MIKAPTKAGFWGVTLLAAILLTVTDTLASIQNLNRPPQERTEERSWTWNSILNTEGIFSDDLKCTGVSVEDSTTVFTTHLDNIDNLRDVYTKYTIQYSKTSTSRERMDIFKRSLMDAFKHNLEARLNMRTWEQGVNKFSDMTFEEFTNSSTGALLGEDGDGIPIIDGTEVDTDEDGTPTIDGTQGDTDEDGTPIIDGTEGDGGPSSGESGLSGSVKRKRQVGRKGKFSVDHRDKGIVNPVQDQANCASCYVFAATAVLESAYAKSHKDRSGRPKLLKLSEKELLDCTEANGNLGCEGGFGAKTFTYLQKEGQTLKDKRRGYPLAYFFPQSKPKRANSDQCSRFDLKPAAKVKKFGRVKPGDEEALRRVVDRYGPTYIGIDLYVPEGHPTFGSYKSGIFDSCLPSPPGKYKGHAVVIVGYGTEYVGKELVDYWIVRNSWGAKWGWNGYIKLRRGANLCGIANQAYAITSVVK